MKPTTEQKDRLRELVLADVERVQIPMRAMDIWMRVSHEEDVMLWGSCIHVGVQLRRLKDEQKVRRVTLPIRSMHGKTWSYRAWVPFDYPRENLAKWKAVVKHNAAPLATPQELTVKRCDDVDT